MSDDLGFMDEVEENVQLTVQELEKEKERLIKEKDECQPFKELTQFPQWEKILTSLKKDVYDNLHYNEEYARLAWGIKMCIQRIEARASHFDTCVERLTRGDE